MRRSTSFALAFLTSLLLVTLGPRPGRGQAGVSLAKSQLIERFLRITSAYTFYDDIVENVTGQYQKRFPQIEKDFWVEFKRDHTHPDDLFGQVIPIYAKYLTEEDLHEILKFFESPVGKKYTAILPDLGRDTGQAALEFERELNSRILRQLKEAGY